MASSSNVLLSFATLRPPTRQPPKPTQPEGSGEAVTTIRVHLITQIPNDWSLSIAAQSAWLHLVYEVLQEAFILPLYYIFGRVISDKKALRERFAAVLGAISLAYAPMTLFIYLSADWLTAGMAQHAELRPLTVQFIRLEAIGIAVGIIHDVLMIFLIALNRYGLLFFLAFIRLFVIIFCDIVFIGSFTFSFEMGVIGVAFTNIIVGCLLSLISLFMLCRFGVLGRPTITVGANWQRDWFRVALRSGLESGVRNLAFSLMVLRLMNEIDQAGLFWIANTFIWSWMLLPVLTLGTLIRQDAGNNAGKLGKRAAAYFVIFLIIICSWLITIPGWKMFITYVLGYKNASSVLLIVMLLLIFYIIFSFNHMIDSYLYGMGRTDLMLYQSLAVNIILYGSAFLAYLGGLYTPTLETIIFLFGGGIVLDTCMTLWQFRRAQYDRLCQEEPIAEGVAHSQPPA